MYGETRDMLLKTLAKENRKTWDEEMAYKDEWRRSMEDITRYYEMKVKDYPNKIFGEPSCDNFSS